LAWAGRKRVKDNRITGVIHFICPHLQTTFFMFRSFFIVLLISLSLNAQSQNNLYVPNGISTFQLWPIAECGGHVYYLSHKIDSVGHAYAVRSYYFSSVNKYNHQLSRSVLLLRDTTFNSYEPYPEDCISYMLNPRTKRFNFFSVLDADSSLYESTRWRRYPKRISFMQLDTNLDVTVAPKPIWYNDRSNKYILWKIGNAQNLTSNRSVLSYNVGDTTGQSSATKFLIVNDTGKLLKDEFLGWESIGSSTQRPEHNLVSGIFMINDNTYTAITYFNDTVRGYGLILYVMDSNMHVLDSLDETYVHYNGPHPAGAAIRYFGSVWENHLSLPTGGYVRFADVEYQDYVRIKYCSTPGIGKGNAASAYQPTALYILPQTDSNDDYHSSGSAAYCGIYNKYDNNLYIFASTKSYPRSWNYYCMNGQASLGQIAAIDTNLNEKWLKYLRPAPGYCIRSSNIVAADGRNGVVISGLETKLSDQGNPDLWRAFIYYIDSNTSLGINNPESPVIISDQFSLYPNPAKDRLVIENVLCTAYTYSIINSIGQAVVSGNGQGIHTNIDVQRYPIGLYVVVVRAEDNRIYSLKFLKG